MIPFLISLLGVCVTFICLFVLYKAGSILYRRKFSEALVKDVEDVIKARETQSSDSKDSVG